MFVVFLVCDQSFLGVYQFLSTERRKRRKNGRKERKKKRKTNETKKDRKEGRKEERKKEGRGKKERKERLNERKKEMKEGKYGKKEERKGLVLGNDWLQPPNLFQRTFTVKPQNQQENDSNLLKGSGIHQDEDLQQYP